MDFVFSFCFSYPHCHIACECPMKGKMSTVSTFRTGVVQGSIPSLHTGPAVIPSRVIQGAPTIGGIWNPVTTIHQGGAVTHTQEFNAQQRLAAYLAGQPIHLTQFDQNPYHNQKARVYICPAGTEYSRELCQEFDVVFLSIPEDYHV